MSTTLSRTFILLLFVVFTACNSSKAQEGTPSGQADASPEEPKTMEQEDIIAVTRGTIPENPRPRLKAVLDETIPEDIWLVYCHVSAAKSVHPSFRFSLSRNGNLYFVERSKKTKDHKVPFDKLLPEEPTFSLSESQIAAIEASLKDLDFFNHPGSEETDSRDGHYDLIRVNQGCKSHTVVYYAIKNNLIAQLQKIDLLERVCVFYM